MVISPSLILLTIYLIAQENFIHRLFDLPIVYFLFLRCRNHFWGIGKLKIEKQQRRLYCYVYLKSKTNRQQCGIQKMLYNSTI